MSPKIKVSAVSYLNTKPLIYGFEKEPFRSLIDLGIEYPSVLAQKLINGTADIGLVPVAVIPRIPNAAIISDYCIAADGPVHSVCLFSEVPVQEIKEVYLDYQSRTSVQLVQVLLKEYWNHDVHYLEADEQYISRIQGATAGVIIGDRALMSLPKYKYVYDLSACWKELTGLPFVFAAWVANRPLEDTFVEAFNRACQSGIDNLDQVIAMNHIGYYDLKKYYTQDILYTLDERKREGLTLFLKKLYPEFTFNIFRNESENQIDH